MSEETITEVMRFLMMSKAFLSTDFHAAYYCHLYAVKAFEDGEHCVSPLAQEVLAEKLEEQAKALSSRFSDLKGWYGKWAYQLGVLN